MRPGPGLAAAALALVLSSSTSRAEGDAHGAPASDHAAEGHGAGAHAAFTDEQVREKLGEVAVHAVNFALLLGVLGYFLRRPLRDFLENRRLAVQHELDESARLKDEADARHREVTARMDGFDREVARLVERVRHECQVEHEQALAAARATRLALLSTARRGIDEETRRARHDLRRETIDLAVGMAEAALRGAVTAADQDRLADEYLDAVMHLDEGGARP